MSVIPVNDWYSVPNVFKQAAYKKVSYLATDADAIKQSIETILKVPIGSIFFNVEFGSDLYKLIDLPVNVALPLILQNTVEAIERWEPRIKLVGQKVAVLPTGSGFEITVFWQIADFVSSTTVNV